VKTNTTQRKDIFIAYHQLTTSLFRTWHRQLNMEAINCYGTKALNTFL